MSHNLSTRSRPHRRYTPQENTQYVVKLGADAAAMMVAARVCLEAGATVDQAAGAEVGAPVLGGLAEAMEAQA